MTRTFGGDCPGILGLVLCTAALASCGGANLGTMPPAVSSGTATSESVVGTRSRAIASATTPDAYMNLVLADGVLAFYRLGDTNLATMTALSAASPPPVDLDGSYGANVTLVTPSITTQTGGTAAFHGSGQSDAIASVYSNPAFDIPSTALSVEAWIVTYGRGFHIPAWTLEINPQSHLVLALKTAGGTVSSVVGTVYYVTATYDGSNAKLYVNGAIDGTLPVSGALDYVDTHPGLALGIGGTVAPAASGVRWSSLQDVGIYASTLTPQQISAHYLA